MRTNREELLTAAAIVLLLIVLNAMLAAKYDGLFNVVSPDYGQRLSYYFHISGFDPSSYSILTEWGMKYDVLRHPLLPYLMYLPCQLNQALISLTGANWAMHIAAAIQLVCTFFTAVYLHRILHRLVGVSRCDASLLTLLFFRRIARLIADGRGIDEHLSTLQGHQTGGLGIPLVPADQHAEFADGGLDRVEAKAWKEGRVLRWWQTALLFIITSGVTLTNGAKIYTAEWIARGRRFFQWRYFLLAVVLPSLLMVGLGLWEERVYVIPKQQAEQAYFEAHRAEMIAKARKNHERYKNAPWVIHKGTPLGRGSLMKWTDITTPRLETLIENVFGEPIQLHEEWVLDDILTSYRPVLLKYRSWWNYAVEALVVLLFLAGVACGWRSRLLWMALLGIVPDALMHLGLGFAINEVYIMAAHWTYAIPIALAFLLLRLKGRWLWAVRVPLIALALWLFVHNVGLIAGWMRQAPVYTGFWYE